MFRGGFCGLIPRLSGTRRSGVGGFFLGVCRRVFRRGFGGLIPGMQSGGFVMKILCRRFRTVAIVPRGEQHHGRHQHGQ